MQLLLRPLFLAGFILSGIPTVQGHPPATDITQAAENFLASLQPPQFKKAFFELKDEERFNWHFIPRDRKGLSFKDMTASQRHLAQALMASALSPKGHSKAATIMSLEQVLHEMENNAPRRDPELYFFSIFGKPGPKQPWGWRLEGHHLSLNFTVEKNQVSATPSFLGSNPAEIKQGPRKGLRVLGAEEDLGRKLVKSLDPEQKKAAIVSTNAPKDIISSNIRKASPLPNEGLVAAKMTASQRSLLSELLKEYLFRNRTEMAENDLQKIEKHGFEKIFFVWAGGLEPGEGHYYRLQGPSFLMEYDNTQNDNNHVHAVWRDFENDFGLDLLKEHYRNNPHP